jgi:CRP-like cAMP-binding protein
MENILRSYLDKFPALGEEEKEALSQALTVRSHPKGTLLLHAGDVADECYLILQGCIRQYHIQDGEEKTTAFFTEEQSVVAFSSYTQGIPCQHFWVCTEDSLLVVGSPEEEKANYIRFPKMVGITRAMMEQGFGKQQEEFAAFMAASPTERYERLCATRPDLLQRIPQHQIASYLGVTPESLSRIRKRLKTQNALKP